MSPSDFLDTIRARNGWPSDYAAAKALGIPTSQVSKYRHNRGGFADELCPKVAELAGFDPGYVLASMHAWRAQSDDARSAWADLARRLAPAALSMLFLWVLLPGAGDALAAAAMCGPVCIMSNAVAAAFLGALALAAAALIPTGDARPQRPPACQA
jgi:hypothetical protein